MKTEPMTSARMVYFPLVFFFTCANTSRTIAARATPIVMNCVAIIVRGVNVSWKKLNISYATSTGATTPSARFTDCHLHDPPAWSASPIPYRSRNKVSVLKKPGKKGLVRDGKNRKPLSRLRISAFPSLHRLT